MLLSLFLSGLKRTVAEKDWGRYIVSGGAWSHFDVSEQLAAGDVYIILSAG
jgi:ATPase complex subunit ATP10